jgi:hypothetical protein
MGERSSGGGFMADEESQKQDKSSKSSSDSSGTSGAGASSDEVKRPGEQAPNMDMPSPSDTFSKGLRAISKDARPEDFDDLQGLYSIMYMERKAERFFKRDPNAPAGPEDSMTAGNKPYDKTEGFVFPYRGKESEKLAECTKAEPKAFLSAAAMYKDLSRHLWAPRLLRQLIGNEIHYYDPIDIERDKNAREGVIKSNSQTFGYPQVSINAVKLYVMEFPILRQYCERKKHQGADFEIRALLDPECAAMIAAAVCEHHLKLWKDQNNEDGVPIPINEKTLAYGYNPDVYDVNGTLETSPVPIYGARKILMPSERVIAASKHVKKVFERDY